MNNFFQRVRSQLLWLIIFLLPWQARYFYYHDTINNQSFELGQLGFYLSSALIICTFILWVPRIHWPKYFWTIGGLVLAWAGLSINWAVSPVMTMYYFGIALMAVCLWLMVRSADGVMVLRALVWSGAMQSIIALAQFNSQFISADSWLGIAEHNPLVPGQSVIIFHGIRMLRSYGLFPHPNMLAGFLVISIISLWLLSLRRVPNTTRYHLLWCALSALLYLGLFVTFSRAALLALIGSWCVLWYATHHRGFASARSMLHYGIVLGVVLALFVNVTNQGLLMQRWESHDRLEKISIQERFTGWGQWERVMNQHPDRWLIGVSPYNYVPVLAATFPGLPVWAYQPVHNIYALLLAEWGLAGIIGLLSLVLWVWLRVRHRHWDILAAASIVIALACMGLVDHWIITSYSGLLLTAVGFGLVRHRVYS